MMCLLWCLGTGLDRTVAYWLLEILEPRAHGGVTCLRSQYCVYEPVFVLEVANGLELGLVGNTPLQKSGHKP